jgi:RNA polymerase sigma-70 factor (ECF subfamily)
MDTAAFQQLVDRHYADLFRFGLSLARRPPDAADLVQQTFAIFAHKGDQLRDPAKAKQWLFTTLYREYIAQFHRESRTVSLDEQPEPHAEALDEITPAHHAEQNDVLRALQTLDEPHRAVLTLFYLQDHRYKDIAAILEVPIGTVMSRLARARILLQKRMEAGASTPDGIKPAPGGSHPRKDGDHGA